MKKGHHFLREPAAVKFAFVDSWRHMRSVETICRKHATLLHWLRTEAQLVSHSPQALVACPQPRSAAEAGRRE